MGLAAARSEVIGEVAREKKHLSLRLRFGVERRDTGGVAVRVLERGFGNEESLDIGEQLAS